MHLDCRFDDAQLRQIIDQATIYMCACPAQVASELLALRKLFTYQGSCATTRPDDLGVHALIAATTAATHATWEDCLDQILTREGWDRETLTMPAGLREIQNEEMLSGRD